MKKILLIAFSIAVSAYVFANHEGPRGDGGPRPMPTLELSPAEENMRASVNGGSVESTLDDLRSAVIRLKALSDGNFLSDEEKTTARNLLGTVMFTLRGPRDGQGWRQRQGQIN